MKKCWKASIARCFCCNDGLNKKALICKRSWDEVSKLVNSINCCKKDCCKK